VYKLYIIGDKCHITCAMAVNVAALKELYTMTTVSVSPHLLTHCLLLILVLEESASWYFLSIW